MGHVGGVNGDGEGAGIHGDEDEGAGVLGNSVESPDIAGVR